MAGCLAVALVIAPGAALGGEASPGRSLWVSLDYDGLSLEARNARLKDVLRAVAEEAGFRVDIAGELDVPVDLSFSRVPLEKGLNRLLQDVSSVFVYETTFENGEFVLSEVRVLRNDGSGMPAPGSARRRTADSEPTPPDVDLYAPRSERLRAVRRLAAHLGEASVDELAAYLALDEDPTVRRVAARGLSRLGGRPARAALVEALRDEDATVRKRAVLGLVGRWRDGAVEPLTTVLLEDPDPAVRRVAAHALGRMNVEAARWALDTGYTDLDDSVRRAADAALTRREQRKLGSSF